MSEVNSGRLASFYTGLVEFPCPDKIDHFVYNDGDRKSKLLSLSLQIVIYNIFCGPKNIVNCSSLLYSLFLYNETIPWSLVDYKGTHCRNKVAILFEKLHLKN